MYMKKVKQNKMTNNAWNKRDWYNHPNLIYPDYKSTVFRNPKNSLIKLENLPEIPSPSFEKTSMRSIDADLTLNAKKNYDPIGERIIVLGKVKDEFGIILEWEIIILGR